MQKGANLLAVAITTIVVAMGQIGTSHAVTPTVTAPASQPQLQGTLELRWGDPTSRSQKTSRFEVTLIDDNGQRMALDPTRALQAAGDLYAMNKRRVSMTLSPSQTLLKANGTRVLSPEVIVPVDNLTTKTTAGITTRAAVTGTQVWVSLMCKFKDVTTEPRAKAFFQGQYGTAAEQLGHYWNEVSYGQINLTGSSAYGWFTLPQNRAYYMPKDANGVEIPDLNKMFNDCTAAANPSVNFAANGGLSGINLMFNAEFDGYNYGGGSEVKTLDGITKSWNTTWMTPAGFNNHATLAHEMGHAFGLPHANNSDNDGDPYDNPWDVMSDGYSNAVISNTYGYLGKHLSIYSRDALGWVRPARKFTYNRVAAQSTLYIEAASVFSSSNNQMIVLPIPGTTTRYYTIEVRRKTGNYEANLAGNAVIIHSVDTTRREPAWSVDAASPPATVSNNEGSMFKVGETWVSPDPAGKKYSVRVVSATTTGFNVQISAL